MDVFEKYLNLALRYLSYRPRSEKELRDYLKRKTRSKKTATLPAGRQGTETQKFSASEKFSDSVVARKTSVIDQVIEKLKENKFLDDTEFVKWWVEQRTKVRPRGIRVIKAELRQKGISDEIVDEILGYQDIKILSDESIKKLIEKRIRRYKNLSKQEIYQKLGSFLARRGFDWDTIKKAIDDTTKKGV